MTDGGGDVMEKSQNGDFIGPQPQDNMSTIIQDTEMAEDEARSEATFRYTVTSFSKLKVGVSIHILIGEFSKIIIDALFIGFCSVTSMLCT